MLMKNRYLNWMPCVLLGFGAVRAAPQPYFITDITVHELGTLGGKTSSALDINDAGEIVGWSTTVNNVKHAFLYRQGLMEDITFGTYSVAEARGINNRSQVVGIISGAESDVVHGFYFDRGSISFLDEVDPSPCITGAQGNAINDAGVIAGEHLVGCGGAWKPRQAHWDSYASPWNDLLPSSAAPLTSTYFTYTHNVNRSGVIVGQDQGLATYSGGFYWQSGTLMDVPMPVGTPPEWYMTGSVQPYGINSYGRIVGAAYVFEKGLPIQPGDGVTHPFFWDGITSESQPLPIFATGQNGMAREINDQDLIAGWADRWVPLANAYKKRAVVWSQGKITMLPLPPGITDTFAGFATECAAFALNNLGGTGIVQVVGYCRYAGKSVPMLWSIKTAQISGQPGNPAPSPATGR
jgi:probable HAF family extracellular repeat protein